MEIIKKNIKTIIPLFIISIVLLIIGVAYAFFTYIGNGTRENVMKVGKISFHYQEKSRSISLNEAMPMTDEQGMLQTNWFDFKITSKSDFAQIPYVITAVKTSDSNMPTDKIRIYLTKLDSEGNETQVLLENYDEINGKAFIGENLEKILYRDIVPVDGKKYEVEYRLRIWISDEAEFIVQNNGVDTYPYQDKHLTLKINVYTNDGTDLALDNITTADDTSIKMVSMNEMYLLESSNETGVDYEVTVPNEVNTANFNIITNNISAISNITELGQTLSYVENTNIRRLGTGTTYNLLVNDNYYKLKITSADKSKEKEYTLKVTREKSKDNNLMYLSVEGYEFKETFDKDVLEYNVSLEETSVNIIANKSSTVASVTGDGVKNLKWGLNTYKITVTSEEGIPKEYTIKINNVKPEPPVITGGSDEWTSNNVTISVLSPGTAISEVDYYEYYVSNSNTTPANNVTVTGQTANEVELSTNGTYYIFYRTVSKHGNKSEWSTQQPIKLDTNTYTIGYTLNGGKLASGISNPVSYKIDTDSFTLNNPSKTGYSFTGWTGSNGNSPDLSVIIAKNSTGNKTYTANYNAKQTTVTLDKQSGTGGSSSVTATYDSNMPSATMPTRTGYTFGGYYTGTNGSGTKYYTDAGASARTWNFEDANKTLYAKWTAIPYTLTVNTQNSKYGTVNTSGGTKYYNDSVTVVATPTTGYIFSGWKDANDKIVSSSSSYTFNMPASNYKLTATFTFDITTISEIKVLNVYPYSEQSTTFQSWMNSYGSGKIKVTPVSIENFNSNPSSYLGTSGNWKYNVVVFGFRDCNSSKDLSAASSSLVATFIDQGHGAIFGHDTITAQGCGDHTNFNSLASRVNLTLGSRSYNTSTTINIVKEGIFTTYPYKIGNIGTTLTIPTTHVYGQTANGDIWLKLVNDQVSDNRNFYLTTYKNTAMIQTGHANGSATADEQKILANIIFYLYSYDLMNQ